MKFTLKNLIKKHNNKISIHSWTFEKVNMLSEPNYSMKKTKEGPQLNADYVNHFFPFLWQHIPKFMRWMKHISFMYYGFRLLLKVQYSGDQLYECQSLQGCKTLQSSSSFDNVNLNGGLQEVWILLAMVLAYRISAYICLHKRISQSNI